MSRTTFLAYLMIMNGAQRADTSSILKTTPTRMTRTAGAHSLDDVQRSLGDTVSRNYTAKDDKELK